MIRATTYFNDLQRIQTHIEVTLVNHTKYPVYFELNCPSFCEISNMITKGREETITIPSYPVKMSVMNYDMIMFEIDIDTYKDVKYNLIINRDGNFSIYKS
jgi:hypothetical protein